MSEGGGGGGGGGEINKRGHFRVSLHTVLHIFLATLLFLYYALWAHFAFTRILLRYITLHYNTRVLRWNTVEVRILIRVADTR